MNPQLTQLLQAILAPPSAVPPGAAQLGNANMSAEDATAVSVVAFVHLVVCVLPECLYEMR